MAVGLGSPSLIVLFMCLLPSQSLQNNDYHKYKIGRWKTIEDGGLEVVPLDSEDSSRTRRYVDTVIPRLADNYLKSPSKDEFSGSFGRRKEAMDMLGDVAIRSSQPLTSSLNRPGDVPSPSPATVLSTPEPPQPAPEKKDPLEDKGLSKTAKKIFANSSKNPVLPQAMANDSIPGMHEENDSHRYTIPDDDEFPQEISNSTLQQHNITSRHDDYHVYYNSTFQVSPSVGQHYWVNMSACPSVTTNEILSQSHRRATTVKLSFDFPFYGHMVRNIAIATGGFLYTGEYLHSWLAATQYIAPLMANFDTSISNFSHVKYCDNGTAFTVEWEKVLLQDYVKAGEFTFQVTLHKNGDIIFVYKKIPILVEKIEDHQHPVKVGLSDAYIIDRTVFFVRRKTIYEYHIVNFKKDDIHNWTVIIMKALPTCLEYKTCETCINHQTGFDCKWCPLAQRCSSGYDRQRQDWQWKQCEKTALSGPNVSVCTDAKAYTHIIPPSTDENTLDEPSSSMHSNNRPRVATVIADSHGSEEKETYLGHTSLGLFLIVLMISGLSLWVLYAYRNPHTQSGQVLIKYRPSQWSLRRGEARYTAASIHM